MKILHKMVILLLSLMLCACSVDVDIKKDDTKEDDTLVAYFSITQNTAAVAQEIADQSDAYLYEIVALDPYEEEDLQYYQDCRSYLEQQDPDARPQIGGEDLDLSSYSIIFIGYPIWYGYAPRIIDAFIEKYDLTGKTIIPFCTSDNSPIGDSDDRLKELANGGEWLEGMRFAQDFTEEDVSAFLEEVLK